MRLRYNGNEFVVNDLINIWLIIIILIILCETEYGNEENNSFITEYVMATLGKIEQFDLHGNENFSEYIERLEQYFFANDIDNDKKQTAVFLTVTGPETYSLLRSLLTPTAPHMKDFKSLSKSLCERLLPKPIVIAKIYKF